jgi:hypothetical protein
MLTIRKTLRGVKIRKGKVLWQSYMHVPRTSTGTNTTTPASSGPVRVLKPSALARERNADGLAGSWSSSR